MTPILISLPLAAHAGRVSSGRVAARSSWQRWSWIAAIGFATGASAPYLSRLMNANERPRLLQAVAIVDHGSFAIDAVVARGIAPGPDVSRAPAIGATATVPNKPPGATLPALIVYGLGRAIGAPPDLAALTLGARLLGAWLPTLLLAWFAARRLGDDAHARAAVTIVVLGTPLASYAHVLFGHSLAALCLFVGATWMLDAWRDAAGRSTLRRAALGGLVAALGVVVEYGVVFAAVPLGVAAAFAWRRGARAPVIAAVLGAVVPMVALGAYHHAVYGSAFSTGYHQAIDAGFAEIHGRGLLGLTWPRAGDVLDDLVSPYGGLLYWAPVVAFVPWGWSRLPDGDARSFARAHAWVFVAMLALTLGLEQAGGWRVGPRYLVAALPAIAPLLAVVLRGIGTREVASALLVGVVVWSVAINALAANWFPHLIPTGNPLRDQLVPLVELGLQPYSALDGFRGRVPGAGAVPVVVALGLVAVALHGVVAPGLRRRVAVAAAIVVVVAGFVAWSVPPAEDAESSLAGLAEIWEPAGPRSPRRVPLGE